MFLFLLVSIFRSATCMCWTAHSSMPQTSIFCLSATFIFPSPHNLQSAVCKTQGLLIFVLTRKIVSLQTTITGRINFGWQAGRSNSLADGRCSICYPRPHSRWEPDKYCCTNKLIADPVHRNRILCTGKRQVSSFSFVLFLYYTVQPRSWVPLLLDLHLAKVRWDYTPLYCFCFILLSVFWFCWVKCNETESCHHIITLLCGRYGGWGCVCMWMLVGIVMCMFGCASECQCVWGCVRVDGVFVYILWCTSMKKRTFI